jgi:hypothetical protein
MGAIGRKKPIATQVRIRKATLATTLTPPRVSAVARRLAYHRSAKATIVATIRMNDLLANECGGWAGAHEALPSCLASRRR